jgi:hypothetical protein
MGLVYLTVVVTVWSGVPYVMGLRAMVRQKRADAEGPTKT